MHIDKSEGFAHVRARLSITPLLKAACERLAMLVVAMAGLSLAPTDVFAQAAASTIQPSEPGAVVRSLMDAMKANDGARIRTLFAHDASQAYGDDKPRSGRAFFAWLESDIIDRKGQVDEPQLVVNGNEVIVTGQYRNSRGYRAAANFRLVVDNGRIVSWQMRY